MYKMNEDEEQDWTFMSTNPPGEWGEARMKRLLDLGYSTASAGDQVDDAVQDVIRAMIEKRAWWNNPEHPVGNPSAFLGSMITSFKNKTIDYHRIVNRERKRSISISTQNVSRSCTEPKDPQISVDPEKMTILNEERDRKRACLSLILAGFVGTLDEPNANVDKATYEFFKERARFPVSSREGEEKSVEYLTHLVGLLSNPRSPDELGLERTAELIKAYMATDPDLTSVAARKRITRLRKKFEPFKEHLLIIYDDLSD